MHRTALQLYVPYLSAYTAHFFALKIRAKSWVRDIRRYPLYRAEFEYCADIYRAQYTRVLSGRLGNTRAHVLALTSWTGRECGRSRDWPTIPKYTALGIRWRSIQNSARESGYRRIPRTHDFALIFRAKECAVYADKYGTFFYLNTKLFSGVYKHLMDCFIDCVPLLF